jgi:hypothetical protein
VPGSGNSWSQSGFNEKGRFGNTWNTWNTPGYNGITGFYPKSPGSGVDSTNKPRVNDNNEHFYETQPYEIGKYVAEDIVGGQTKFIEHAIDYQDKMDAGKSPKFGYRSFTGLYGNLIVNGFKLGAGENAATDAYDNIIRAADTVEASKNIKEYNKRKKSGEFSNEQKQPKRVDKGSSKNKNKLAKINDSWKGMKPLSKFNVGLAAAGTVMSGVETGFTIADSIGTFKDSSASGAEKTSAGADIGEGVGNTLMSAGVVTAAIPGGQLAGGLMVAGGAGIWAISKGVNLFAKNWKGNLGSTAKEIGRKAKNSIKKGWKTVKGWFS